MSDSVSPFILGFFAVVIAGFGLAYIIFWLKFRGREKISLNLRFLEVRVPKENEIEIGVAEQLYANLHAIANKRKLLSLSYMCLLHIIRRTILWYTGNLMD